jgi:hypothetical protein
MEFLKKFLILIKKFNRQTSRISLDINDISSNNNNSNNKLNLDNYMQTKPTDNEKLRQHQRSQVIFFFE